MSAGSRRRPRHAWMVLSVAGMMFAVVGVLVGRIRLGVILAGVVLLVALAAAMAEKHGRRRPLRRVERL